MRFCHGESGSREFILYANRPEIEMVCPVSIKHLISNH
jgi:hypothetical protein